MFLADEPPQASTQLQIRDVDPRGAEDHTTTEARIAYRIAWSETGLFRSQRSSGLEVMAWGKEKPTSTGGGLWWLSSGVWCLSSGLGPPPPSTGGGLWCLSSGA